MKKFKITKLLSLALATVIAVSTFTINSYAMSDTAKAHKRDLTADEVTAITKIFDAKYYAKVYPDVVDALGTDDATTMLTHFLAFGLWEERQPCANFNVDVYASRNPDVAKVYGDDIVGYYVHYSTFIKSEAWRPLSTLYDAYQKNVTVYSVYDFVKGQTTPKTGATIIQTYGYAPALGIGVN